MRTCAAWRLASISCNTPRASSTGAHHGNSAPNATLPASWAGLGQLAVLDLTGTGVAGGLPEDWAHMSGLRTLLLGGNSLNGTLPAAWGALVGLTTL